MALDSLDGLEIGLCLLKSNFSFAENSTEIFGDPLEGTSIWIWNNTGLVREDELGHFSLFFALFVMFHLFLAVQSFNLVLAPVNMGQNQWHVIKCKHQSLPKVIFWFDVSELFKEGGMYQSSWATSTLSVASAASEHHMVVTHQDGVPEVQRRAGGEGLRVCPRHYPHVLHPVLWHLCLLHVSEEVQDQPVLPHNCELLCPSRSTLCFSVNRE